MTEVTGLRPSPVKWLGTLDDRAQKDLQAWLNRMPDSVRRAMNLPD
ncbi:hypothetical protein [Deinococcus knuensis]|uniref:Transposase n=1 Tax=Deinococcus knuensis TaxID=1837380 RepID=A0ABQ2SQB2_9DEIO|nr:hypothetical protein [Deinococcus knuensis]GGS36982.1 hypothetical protein GCM10008961_30790 [Deinococcus knuensis]